MFQDTHIPSHLFRLGRVWTLAGLALLGTTTFTLTGCGPSETEANVDHNTGPLTVKVRNRTGTTVQKLYISNFDATLSYGSVKAGATDTLQLDPQVLPKSIEVQWRLDDGSTVNKTISLGRTGSQPHHGTVTIDIHSTSKASARVRS